MENFHKSTAIQSILFLIVSLVDSNFEKHQQMSPEIWLSRFLDAKTNLPTSAESQFRFDMYFNNSCILKNGSDYVAYEQAKEVVFTCEAAYPVKWKITNVEHVKKINYHNIDTRDYRISSFGPESKKPVNLRFKSLLQFYFDRNKFIGVNLTCSSVEIEPQLMSSIYLYRKGGIVMDYVTERKRIYADSHKNVLVPCRPSSPDMTVTFEKSDGFAKSEDGKSKQLWTPLSVPSKTVCYDPKVGFTLYHDSLGDKIFGEYRCSASPNNNPKEGKYFAHFSIQNVKDSSVKDANPQLELSPLVPKSILKGHASVRIAAFHSNSQAIPTIQFVCCSGIDNKPPKLYMQWCGNQVSYQTLAETIQDVSTENGFTSRRQDLLKGTSDCALGELYGTSHIVVCRGENVDFMDHYTRLFNPFARNSTGTITNQSFITSILKYENSALVESALPTQKLMLVLGKRVDKPPSGPGVHFSAAYKDMLGEEGDDDDVPKGLTLNAEIKQRTSYTHVVEYQRDVYYNGEPLIFMCFGSQPLFGRGAYLKLIWMNGTETEIKIQKRADTATPLGSRIVYLQENQTIGNGDMVVSIFGEELHAKPDMVRVDCWMPLVASSKWETISKKLTVLPGTAPNQ